MKWTYIGFAWLLVGTACSGGNGGSNQSDADSTGADIISDLSSVDETSSPDGTAEGVDATDPQPDTGLDSTDCTPGSGCFLESCQLNTDCQSGVCGLHLGELLCSDLCTDECPVGWSCQTVETGPSDTVSACVSNASHLCLPCIDDGHCSANGIPGLCLDYGEAARFCGATCEGEGDCPSGYTCEVQEGAAKQCVATDGVCSCSEYAVSMELATDCAWSNGAGICTGVRICTVDGLADCNAAEPAAEICNGLDDNCDQAVDEGDLCNDDNSCTFDDCTESGCDNVPMAGSSCDDGNLNTSDDECDAEGNCVGTEYVCPTGDCIWSSTANGTDCDLQYKLPGSVCDDGVDNTRYDECDGAGGCSGDWYSCEPAACEYSSTPDGTGCEVLYTVVGFPCNDGDSSTQNDQCDGLGACAGDHYTCPAAEVCTSYVQNGIGCVPVYAGVETSCDDGDPDTTNDSCNGAGACEEGSNPNCPQTTDCIDSYAGPECAPNYALNGAPCDDGDGLTVDDVCDGAGACAGIVPVCGNGIIEGGEDCDGPGCCACTLAESNPLGCVLANTVLNGVVEQQKLTADDGTSGDCFGYSVAISGDILVVGANLDDDNGSDSGSVYVHSRNSGAWSLEQKLVASDGAQGDIFGERVAISGETIVVAARVDDDIGLDSGSVYIYTRSDGVWTEQKLTASDGAQGDYFGHSVAIHADTLVVGANFDDDLGNNSGSVYVYARSGGLWTPQQKITAYDGAEADLFGDSVAISGDTLVVGARLDNDNAANSGSVYVYTRSMGNWSLQQKLVADDPEAFDYFGASVSISGETLVVGSIHEDTNGYQSGSAYIYSRSGPLWSLDQKIIASDGASEDEFGYSVSIDGDVLVVGARKDDDKGVNSGAGYVFLRSNGAWTEQQKISAGDGANGDEFGFSLSVGGGTVMVGVRLDDDNGADSGSTYGFGIRPMCTTVSTCTCKPGFSGADCGSVDP